MYVTRNQIVTIIKYCHCLKCMASTLKKPPWKKRERKKTNKNIVPQLYFSSIRSRAGISKSLACMVAGTAAA